ncbi:hypothetical protein P3548_25075, partial [Vibrio parahaemolyticus]|nr:hypothetical protein [Vibrio parahaemolyticus]
MSKNQKWELNRRTLLKGMGAIGVAALSPNAFSLVNENKPIFNQKPRIKLSEYKTFRSTCAMECLHCNLTAFTHKRKLIKIEASEGFNVKCCLRGMS